MTTNADLQPWELERDAALGKIHGIPAGIPNLFSCIEVLIVICVLLKGDFVF